MISFLVFSPLKREVPFATHAAAGRSGALWSKRDIAVHGLDAFCRSRRDLRGYITPVRMQGS
jgi:hypothetical protein